MTKILKTSFYFKGRDFREDEIIMVNGSTIHHVWIHDAKPCIICLPYSEEFMDILRAYS